MKQIQIPLFIAIPACAGMTCDVKNETNSDAALYCHSRLRGNDVWCQE